MANREQKGNKEKKKPKGGKPAEKPKQGGIAYVPPEIIRKPHKGKPPQ